MTTKQRLELRASEIRKRLAELADVADLNDEQRSEIGTLRTEYADVEVKLQAAITASDETTEVETRETGDAEARELRELRGKVNLGEYIHAAAEQRGLEGAEAEYNQATGHRGSHFPLELLDEGPIETRAETDTDTAANTQTWLDRLFAESTARRLGVTMRSVPKGQAVFPVTTAGASGAQRGRQEAAADAAWTIGSTVVEPTRNAVRAVFSLEDDYRNPGLQEALRRDLRAALMDSVDLSIIEGDDGADENSADITGLQSAADVVEKTLTQANKVKGDKTLEAFAELIDGKHATGLDQLNIVASVGAVRLWLSTLVNSNADNQTVAQFLRASGLSWMARADIDDATTNGKFGAFIGRARGIAGAAVAAIWDSGQFIRDPYTGAAKGEVGLTLSYYWGFKLPRPSNFARLKFVSN